MAREFKDNPSLLKELAEDEKIVWKGAPEAFPLITSDTKPGLIKRWVICAVAAIAFVAVYLAVNASTGTINGWILLIVFIAVVYFAAVPVLDRNNVFKKCKYYITDRHVFLDYAEKEIYSLPLAGLKREIADGEAGCIHVMLGSCVGVHGKKRRVSAFVPQKDDQDNVCGLVLYNIPDDDKIRAIFSV